MEPRPRRRESGIVLTRMQCAGCNGFLACDFDRRRDVMICPICKHQSALTYVPPNEPYLVPLNDMPVALPLPKGKSFLKTAIKTLAAAAVGFVVCVTVYALDYGGPINQWAKNRVHEIRGRLGLSVPEKKREPALSGPTGYTTEDWGIPSSEPSGAYRVGPGNKVQLPTIPERLRRTEPASQPARPEPPNIRYRFMVLDRENGELIGSRVHIVAESLESAKRTISQLARQEGFAVIEDPDGNVPNPDVYNPNNPLTQGRAAPPKGMTEIAPQKPSDKVF